MANVTELIQEFLPAIKGGDFKKVKEIINHLEKDGQDLLSVINAAYEKNDKDSMLRFAIQGKNVELVELLLKKGLLTKDKQDHDNLVHQAIKLTDSSIFHKLIEYGISLRGACNHRLPPLFELVVLGKLELIQKFSKKGVSFQGKTKDGESLLHFALSKKNSTKELIRLLLRYGASLSARNEEDLTPLHFLITLPNHKSTNSKVKLLLKYGSDVNASSTKKEETVLHTALRKGNMDTVELLLMYGADTNLKDGKKNTAFYQCKLQYKVEISEESTRKFDKEVAARIIVFFLREIIKKQFIPKFIDSQNFETVAEFQGMYSVCLYDIRNNFIDEIAPGITLRHILLANENELTTYIQNAEVRKCLESREIEKFETWLTPFRFLLKKGKERKILLEKCGHFFKKALEWEAPPVVVDEIFSYLSRTDLRSLYAACNPESFFEKVTEKIRRSEDQGGTNNESRRSSEEDDDEKLRFIHECMEQLKEMLGSD